MNLQALAQEIYEINKANGWHDGEPRSWAEICLLIESEIAGEAVEALRDPYHAVTEIWYREDGKPEGFVTEIADGVIRALDGMVEHGIPVVDRFDEMLGYFVGAGFIGKNKLIHQVRALSFNTHAMDKELHRQYHVCRFIAHCIDLIKELGHDPEKVIREKMAYNRGRGHKHGGKKL